ncbi:hypothetical protein IMY05_C4468000500 [Salix suchowensis]|nr:hypothetical protein IMY05_C4468000500 [Salix suchowensis]
MHDRKSARARSPLAFRFRRRMVLFSGRTPFGPYPSFLSLVVPLHESSFRGTELDWIGTSSHPSVCSVFLHHDSQKIRGVSPYANPYFIPRRGCPSDFSGTRGIPSLKHIEWNGQLSYTDLHKLFRLLHFPSLEIIDICVDKISDHGVRLGAEGVMIFKCLKELYIQFECDFDNNKHESSLRCYAFPHLEKLDLINTGLCPIHGTVPRLEQIFRDPRLPHLTHLTLSRYEITTAQRTEVQAILGYLPALTYLGLDTCVGVGVVLDCLTDLTLSPRLRGTVPARASCRREVPGCNDLEIKDLRAVITARNKQYEAMPGQEQDNDISSRALSRKEKNAQLLRVIKPLRKPRSQQHGEPRQEKAKIDLEPSSMTHMDHGVPVPIIGVPTPTADLIHVRIEGCEAVKEEEALSLEKLGV